MEKQGCVVNYCLLVYMGNFFHFRFVETGSFPGLGIYKINVYYGFAFVEH